MDWLWPLLAAPFIGSFLGVLIRRLPQGGPVIADRSRCEHCGVPIAFYDLVPLLSYVMLRGRCRRCGGRIANVHWQVELASLLVPASALAAGLGGAWLWAVSGAGWTLLTLGWIDWNCMLLPDALTLPLILAGLAATWMHEPASLTEHALAAALAWAALRGVALAYRRLRRREGLGAGDAKLLAALAAWIGLDNLPLTLLGAALGGLLWAVVDWALFRRPRGETLHGATAVAFGPFLALTGWIVLIWM